MQQVAASHSLSRSPLPSSPTIIIITITITIIPIFNILNRDSCNKLQHRMLRLMILITLKVANLSYFQFFIFQTSIFNYIVCQLLFSYICVHCACYINGTLCRHLEVAVQHVGADPQGQSCFFANSISKISKKIIENIFQISPKNYLENLLKYPKDNWKYLWYRIIGNIS